MSTNGDYYHMLLVDDYVPAVKNGKTGKIVKFDWHDLFNKALERGLVDETRGNENE